MSLTSEVEATLAALDLDPRDAAAAALARVYAATIDGFDDEQRAKLLGQIGPSLLRALEALGATPAARGKQPEPIVGAGPLAALRAVQ